MSGNCGGGGGGGNGGGQGNDCFAKVRSTPSWKHRHTHFAPLCLYIHKHLRKLRVWMGFHSAPGPAQHRNQLEAAGADLFPTAALPDRPTGFLRRDCRLCHQERRLLLQRRLL